jgi:phospholipid/cholesterol/gamma-HCH transport system substrate-binding protein
MGGSEGREQLQTIFDNINTSVARLSSVGDVLDRVMTRNEDNIDSFLQMGSSFQASIDKISNVFDRDFNRIAAKFENSAGALEEASIQARDGLRSVSSVAEKIDEGKGLLGKLVNEDETYRDLKIAVEGFKNYLTKVDRMQVVFDSHFESMIRRAEGYEWEDSKGFFGMRIYPREDYFYLIQLAGSDKGYTKEKFIEKDYFDAEGKPINTDALQNEPLGANLTIDDLTRLAFVLDHKKVTTKRNVFTLDVQFGKIFQDIAFRFGLFEGTAGVGMDIEIPFSTDKFRWVTSLELYDMTGANRRIEDRRPHAKWLNKMFIFNNIYTTFGADDFASKRNASVFFGAGIRFGDDDIKYFLSSLSGLAAGFTQ